LKQRMAEGQNRGEGRGRGEEGEKKRKEFKNYRLYKKIELVFFFRYRSETINKLAVVRVSS